MYELLCFGRVGIEGETGEEIRLRSQKHLALLVYLASWPRRRHPREKLAALFWDTEPRLARHSLSQALYDIRKTLPRLGIEATVKQLRLPEKSGLRFEAREFERAIRENDLSRAVDLYEGDFVPDLEEAGTPRFTRWVEGERYRLRLKAGAVLQRHVRTSDGRAHWGEMFHAAEKLLQLDDLDEHAHRAVMRGLWLQGDQVSALRHFDQHRDLLAEELPGGISEETTKLVDRIRSSRPGANDRLVDHGSPGEMVGRDEEFELLQERLRSLASGGEGGFVVVRGEAGLGKTRLLEELKDVAALEEVRVLESRCYAAESEVPFGPVVDGLGCVAADRAGSEDLRYYQLGHLFPTLFGEPDRDADPYGAPAAGRRRLFEEAADLVQREMGHRPVLWVVEDVHWIDSSSAALLHHLIRRLNREAFLLIVSVREFERIQPTAAGLLEGRDDPVERVTIDLEPLSLDETRKLLDQLEEGLGDQVDCRAFHRLSGGNPYYLVELARLREEVEEIGAGEVELRALSRKALRGEVGALIHRRLRGLSPGALRILEVAAVAGREASPGLVAAASGLELPELSKRSRELYAHGLLEDVDGRIEFPHDITRDYVYRKMGGLQRSALHLAVAETLAMGEKEVQPGVLAHHFRAADDSARAYEYAILAAREFRGGQGHEEAISHAEFALKVATGSEERTAALEILSQAELAVGNLAQAQSYLEDLIQLGSLPPRETARIRLDLIHAHVEQSDWEGAIEQLDELDKRLEEVSPEARLEAEMRALYFRLKVAMRRKDHATATQAVERARGLLESYDSSARTSVSLALYNMIEAVYATFTYSSEVATRHLESVGPLPPRLSASVHRLKGIVYTRRARWEEAEYQFKSALGYAREHRDILLTASLLNNLACCALARGEWDAAKEKYRRVLDISETLPRDLYLTLNVNTNLANAHWYSGQTREARGLYKRCLESAERVDARSTLINLRSSLGLINLQQGDFDQASDYYKDLKDLEAGRGTGLSGVQDRFKYLWFTIFMECCDDGRDASKAMKAAVNSERDTDIGSSLMLDWLSTLLREGWTEHGWKTPEKTERIELKRQLQDRNLGWFAYFSRRWLQQTAQSTLN